MTKDRVPHRQGMWLDIYGLKDRKENGTDSRNGRGSSQLIESGRLLGTTKGLDRWKEQGISRKNENHQQKRFESRGNGFGRVNALRQSRERHPGGR